MKKIINQADNFVSEMLEGIYDAHPHEFNFAARDLYCLVNMRKHQSKVDIATRGDG